CRPPDHFLGRQTRSPAAQRQNEPTQPHTVLHNAALRKGGPAGLVAGRNRGKARPVDATGQGGQGTHSAASPLCPAENVGQDARGKEAIRPASSRQPDGGPVQGSYNPHTFQLPDLTKPV